jgi:hypothetical protein
MKTLFAALALLFLLGACAGEKTKSEPAASTQAPQPEAAPPSTQTASSESSSSESAEEATQGVWAGQLRIDAHAGMATLNYVGAESGDFVPMRFRTSSEVATKILAACADEDLCEFEGAVRFLDEPPPENASAVGEIVRVDRVKKLPPDAR